MIGYPAVSCSLVYDKRQVRGDVNTALLLQRNRGNGDGYTLTSRARKANDAILSGAFNSITHSRKFAWVTILAKRVQHNQSLMSIVAVQTSLFQLQSLWQPVTSGWNKCETYRHICLNDFAVGKVSWNIPILSMPLMVPFELVM